MQAVVAPAHHQTIIRLEGPIDEEAAAFLSELLDVMLTSTEPRDAIVLDLRSVQLLDSIGVGVLLAAGKRYRAHDRALRLRAPQPPIRRVLEATGVTERVPLET